MTNEIDILENDIREKYPEVLEILLSDHTTQKNIFWVTDNYNEFGQQYKFSIQILPELISGENVFDIMQGVSINIFVKGGK